jgi:hypothetical protein
LLHFSAPTVILSILGCNVNHQEDIPLSHILILPPSFRG